MNNKISQQQRIRLDHKRRDFIKKSTLLGAGVGASVLIPGSALARGSEDTAKPSASKGYELTPHIVEYYKSIAS